MKEKIKRIVKIIATVVAILWIFSEIAFTSYYDKPNLTVIIGILVIWGIIMYSLKEKDQVQKGEIVKRDIAFCGNCGAKIKENVTFCDQCGKKISHD